MAKTVELFFFPDVLALRQRSAGLRACASADSYFMCGLCDPNLEKSRTNLDTQTLEEPLLSARAENNHARAENKRGGGALLN